MYLLFMCSKYLLAKLCVSNVKILYLINEMKILRGIHSEYPKYVPLEVWDLRGSLDLLTLSFMPFRLRSVRLKLLLLPLFLLSSLLLFLLMLSLNLYYSSLHDCRVYNVDIYPFFFLVRAEVKSECVLTQNYLCHDLEIFVFWPGTICVGTRNICVLWWIRWRYVQPFPCQLGH